MFHLAKGVRLGVEKLVFLFYGRLFLLLRLRLLRVSGRRTTFFWYVFVCVCVCVCVCMFLSICFCRCIFCFEMRSDVCVCFSSIFLVALFLFSASNVFKPEICRILSWGGFLSIRFALVPTAGSCAVSDK